MREGRATSRRCWGRPSDPRNGVLVVAHPLQRLGLDFARQACAVTSPGSALDNIAADALVWFHPDMTLVFAAGNYGIDAGGGPGGQPDGVIDSYSMASPASSKNVIAVGAMCEATSLFPRDSFLTSLREALKSRCALVELNEEAFQWGERSCREATEAN